MDRILNSSGLNEFCSMEPKTSFNLSELCQEDGESSSGPFTKYPMYMGVSSIISFAGNAVILHAVAASETFCRPVNYMLGNFAFTSIIRVILANVFVFDHGHIQAFSEWTCRLYPVIVRVYSSAEGFTMLFLSLSRARIIRNPWDRETGGKAFRKIAITWIIGFLIEIPRIFLWDFDSSKELPPGEPRCTNVEHVFGSYFPLLLYAIFHFLVVFFIPSIFLVQGLVQSVIDFRILTSTCKDPVGLEKSSRRKLERRLVRNSIIFTSVFMLVKLPTGVWFFLWSLPTDLVNEGLRILLKDLFAPMFLIVYLNAAFFPFLIFGLSHELRNYCYKYGPGRLLSKDCVQTI